MRLNHSAALAMRVSWGGFQLRIVAPHLPSSGCRMAPAGQRSISACNSTGAKTIAPAELQATHFRVDHLEQHRSGRSWIYRLMHVILQRHRDGPALGCSELIIRALRTKSLRLRGAADEPLGPPAQNSNDIENLSAILLLVQSTKAQPAQSTFLDDAPRSHRSIAAVQKLTYNAPRKPSEFGTTTPASRPMSSHHSPRRCPNRQPLRSASRCDFRPPCSSAKSAWPLAAIAACGCPCRRCWVRGEGVEVDGGDRRDRG